ncbi:MAG: hypothetical protein GY760_29340, partial [Deltaproteobacteria bacterium]|nr:hypothetical protein [Deltaproteobacteria bacterium]
MKYYCMPSDFKKETIDSFDKLNHEYKDSRVVETYGNITVGNELESGRVSAQLPEVDLIQLEEFIKYSKSKGIDFNYTLNSPHYQNKEFTNEGVSKIKSFLKTIYDIGVRTLTVASPSMIEIVQASPYGFNIVGSTLCQITNSNKAEYFKKLGLKRIVVDESINRDFNSLKDIGNLYDGEVEIIVNPICLKDCIYRTFHYNQIGFDSTDNYNKISHNFYEHRCIMQRHDKISNILRSCWIRPEDLNYYEDSKIYYFKLQGRQSVLHGDPLKTLKAYFDMSYDGDLMEFIQLFHKMNSFNIKLDNRKLDGFLKP